MSHGAIDYCPYCGAASGIPHDPRCIHALAQQEHIAPPPRMFDPAVDKGVFVTPPDWQRFLKNLTQPQKESDA